MRIKFELLFLLAGCCLPVGCSTFRPDPERQARELRARLQAVVVEDGINQQEADAIAQGYYRRFSLSACGVAAAVTDEGDFWISRTYTGYAAVPTREPIRIDKKTGRVTWSDGPTLDDPKTIQQ